MVLKSIRSNHSSFKRVDFREGYNIILADRQSKDEDDHKKTRNGAGKLTLVEIIHFCLGSQVNKDSIFKSKELEGWSFTLEFNIGEFDFEIERGVDTSNKIILHRLSPRLGWDLKTDKDSHTPYIAPSVYNEELYDLFFGLSKNGNEYMPSFRELISYYARRNIDGYRDAFEFFKNQKAYSRQACNAYFIDLNVEIVSRFQKLKDETKKIDDYRRAAASGVIGTFSLDVGKLETEVINRKTDVENMRIQLESFHVHPQYNEITDEANALTEKIHQFSDTLALRQQLLSRYEKSMDEEISDISTNELQQIYEEAGILFADNVKVKLNEVVDFHKALLSNRREYLHNEIIRLRNEILRIREQIEVLTNERAKSLQILESHGALEEYTRLQEKYSRLVQLYEDAKKRKEAALQIEERKSRIKIETQELLLLARHDYAERISIRERAVSLFRENTEFLYQEPGTLTIEIKDTGYDFDVEIKSAKSQGVNYMKVFCYDMLIAELGASRKYKPGFLIHDSTIFDGVDERQIALALTLAKRKCDEIGFQYICLMNSDTIPERELDEKFLTTFMDSVVLRLDDSTDIGGLLGIRF
ncbi:MAG: DUF2326 domain-containing protein [Prevotella sp.]|jgi:uncharacterized protein YydD (DUF2326 family)|nr:DUF2326 domain-containing protein [Prevotella sp.]